MDFIPFTLQTKQNKGSELSDFPEWLNSCQSWGLNPNKLPQNMSFLHRTSLSRSISILWWLMWEWNQSAECCFAWPQVGMWQMGNSNCPCPHSVHVRDSPPSSVSIDLGDTNKFYLPGKSVYTGSAKNEGSLFCLVFLLQLYK